jgi:hypothetical protein
VKGKRLLAQLLHCVDTEWIPQSGFDVPDKIHQADDSGKAYRRDDWQ